MKWNKEDPLPVREWVPGRGSREVITTKD